MRRLLARCLAVGAVVFAVLVTAGVATAGPAWAGPAGSPAPAGAGAANLFCATKNSSLRYKQHFSAGTLPIDRWASSTSSLHTNFGGGAFGLGLNDLAQRIQRNGIETISLTTGNALWKAGTDITEAATNFCFADSLGATADHFAAVLGNAISSSGIEVIPVVFVIVVALWQTARGSRGSWKPLLKTFVTLGVFAAMIGGATATTSTGPPAPMSPGWMINSIYSTVSNVAALPTAAVAMAADQSLTSVSARDTSNELSCANYEGQLLRNYKADYGTGLVAQAPASVPMAIDSMWEQTGLRAYQDIQFGTQAPASSLAGAELANHYGLRVYCRVLDSQAGIPAAYQIGITSAGAAFHGPPSPNPQSAAWLSPSDSNSTIDASIIAWAACKYSGGWHVATGFQLLTGNHKVTGKDCQNWWSSSAGSWSQGPFHWSTNTNAVNNYAASSPQVANFLLNWHGDANGQAMVTAIMFVPASLAIFLVFLLLSGALLIAKMAMLVLIILSPIVLVLSMLPGGRYEGAATKLGKYTFGLAIFSVTAQLILSLVALISGFLVQAGAGLFGPGSIMTILWTAFTPFAALWLMHHLFKMIGAPSPFKLNGALGWAAAAGGVGAGIGEAMHRRTAGRAAQGLRLAGKNMKGSAAKFISQPQTRTGGLSPASKPAALGKGTGATGAGAAALGAANGATSAGSRSGAGQARAGQPGAGTGAAATGAGSQPKAGQAGTSQPGAGAATGTFGTGTSGAPVTGTPGTGASGTGTPGSSVPARPPRPRATTQELLSQENQEQAVAAHYRSTLVGPPPGNGSVWDNAKYGVKSRAAVPIAAVNERLREHGARFRQAPVRNTLKTAAKAGLVGAAVLATPVSGGATLGVVAGVMAARRARRAHLEHPERKAFAQRQRLEAWRADEAQQTQLEAERAGQAQTDGAPVPEPKLKPVSKPSPPADLRYVPGAPGQSEGIVGGGSGSDLAGHGAVSGTPGGGAWTRHTAPEPPPDWSDDPEPDFNRRYDGSPSPVEPSGPGPDVGQPPLSPSPDEVREPALAGAVLAGGAVVAGSVAAVGGAALAGSAIGHPQPPPVAPSGGEQAWPHRPVATRHHQSTVLPGAAPEAGAPARAAQPSVGRTTDWSRVRSAVAAASSHFQGAPVRSALRTAGKMGLIAGAAAVSPTAGAVALGAAGGLIVARARPSRPKPETVVRQPVVNMWRRASEVPAPAAAAGDSARAQAQQPPVESLRPYDLGSGPANRGQANQQPSGTGGGAAEEASAPPQQAQRQQVQPGQPASGQQQHPVQRPAGSPSTGRQAPQAPSEPTGARPSVTGEWQRRQGQAPVEQGRQGPARSTEVQAPAPAPPVEEPSAPRQQAQPQHAQPGQSAGGPQPRPAQGPAERKEPGTGRQASQVPPGPRPAGTGGWQSREPQPAGPERQQGPGGWERRQAQGAGVRHKPEEPSQ